MAKRKSQRMTRTHSHTHTQTHKHSEAHTHTHTHTHKDTTHTRTQRHRTHARTHTGSHTDLRTQRHTQLHTHCTYTGPLLCNPAVTLPPLSSAGLAGLSGLQNKVISLHLDAALCPPRTVQPDQGRLSPFSQKVVLSYTV